MAGENDKQNRDFSLEEILAEYGGGREKLLRDKEQAGMSRTLAEIVCSAPVNAAPGAYKKDAPDAPAAARLLTDLEMYATLDKLRLPAEAGPQQPGFARCPSGGGGPPARAHGPCLSLRRRRRDAGRTGRSRIFRGA